MQPVYNVPCATSRCRSCPDDHAWPDPGPMNIVSEPAVSTPVIELKARLFKLPLLRLLGPDMDAVANELETKAREMPELFRDSPVIIDLGKLNEAHGMVEFPLLVGLLRGYGLVPVGVWRGTEDQNEAARAMDLAIVSRGMGATPAVAASGRAEKAEGAPPMDKVVRTPVRSGQRIYASGGNLIVLSQVSSGSELVADGSIHVYGALRGRALAGVRGNSQAHIFCQELHAELVSIAGRFRTADDLDAGLVGRPAHIWLEGRRLRMAGR